MTVLTYAFCVTMLAAMITVVVLMVQLTRFKSQSELHRLAFDRCKITLELSEDVGRFGTWHINGKTWLLHWSDYVFDMHHRPHSNGPPTIKDAIAYYHPDDRDMVENAVKHALNEGEDFEFRARIITDKRQEIPVLSRGTCQFDRYGSVVGVFGCFVDLSAPHERN